MAATDLDDLVDMYERYLALVEPAAVGESRRRLANWMRDGIPQLHVRVVLPGRSDHQGDSDQVGRQQ